MNKHNITPENLTSLQSNEIFVFGSNLKGSHGGGAALVAYERFGAIQGQGIGLQGQSYAIPTMQGGIESIEPYVNDFLHFAIDHPEMRFYVTRIGRNFAGFRDSEIAPLFRLALELENIYLPESFIDVLAGKEVESTHFKDFMDEYDFYITHLSDDYRLYSEKIRSLRVRIYHDTISTIREGRYLNYDKEYIGLHVSNPQKETVLDKITGALPLCVCPYQTQFRFSKEDWIDLINELKNNGFNPILHCSSSRRNPGGGVLLGAGSQEEMLFRRSDIAASLYQFGSAEYIRTDYLSMFTHNCELRYPIDPDYGYVYASNICFFRRPEEEGYSYMDSVILTDIVCVPPVNRPKLTADNLLKSSSEIRICNKMRTILRVSYSTGHDAVILGNFGFGGLMNPPSEIARLWHKILDEEEFTGRFKHIVFTFPGNNIKTNHNYVNIFSNEFKFMSIE